MTGHSVPIDYWVDPAKISNPVERKTIMQDLIPLIEPYSGKLSEVLTHSLPHGHYLSVYASDSMTFTIKLYSKGLVSTTLDYFTSNINEHKIVNDDGRKLEREIRKRFSSNKFKVLPAIKRAPPYNPYFLTSDGRILEYDVDELLFDEQSEFQRVQIFHSKSYGNMLVLDDLQNLAESDLSYTHALMNHSIEDFKDKEILILGGGDGALLWELLKEKPKFVTMIEIDEVVIKSCRKLMRSVCGDCMDNYNGSNYKIIVDDAIKYMKTYMNEGRQFDYVFGDLTDVPISTSPIGEHWEFVLTILSMGTSLLKKGSGKYMTHAIGLQCTSALDMLEDQIAKLPSHVTFTRTNCHIPSFMENWCFYQLTRVS